MLNLSRGDSYQEKRENAKRNGIGLYLGSCFRFIQ